MISKGSCDTENSKDKKKIRIAMTRINYILKYIKTENNYFKL